MKLEITQTRTGFVVRPEGAVGSIGWSPKPWSAQYFSSRSKAQQYINQAQMVELLPKPNEGELA